MGESAHPSPQVDTENFTELLSISSVPLLHRAWVYQEMLLSPRVLHFGPEELVWECDQAVLCECSKINGNSSEYLGSSPNPRNTFKLFCESDPLAPFSHHQNSLRLWQKMVNQYSRLSLTKRSDRIPALSGIASMKPGKDNYLAGMWANDLPHCLFWTTDSFFRKFAAKRVKIYQAPSWAWPSMDGPIYFWPTYKLGRATFVATYLEGSCTHAGVGPEGEPVGCVINGYIKLEAPVLHCKVAQVYTRSDQASTACEVMFSDMGWWSMQKAKIRSRPRLLLRHTFTLDQSTLALEEPSRDNSPENTSELHLYPVSAEVAVGDDVQALIVAYNNDRPRVIPEDIKGHGVWALVLKRSNSADKSYQRIGIIWPMSNRMPSPYEKEESCDLFTKTRSWLKDPKKSILTIV
jgi:hypothetical protein